MNCAVSNRRFPLRARGLLWLVVVCLLGGLGIWGGRWWYQADWHLRQGQVALLERDFASARTHFQAYLALRSGSSEGHFLLARACRRARVEDFSQARQHLQRAQALGWPESETALEDLMLDFQEHALPGEPLQTLIKYVQSRGQDHALVCEALVRGLIRANHKEDAHNVLNLWVNLYPDDWYPLLWRGAFFAYSNEANLAIADFQKLLPQRPSCAEVYRHLGLQLVRSGYNYEQALRYLDVARQSDPEDPDTLVGMAACHRALGRLEPAHTLLDQVISVHPEHFGALLELALVAQDGGNDMEEFQWLQRLEPLSRQSRQKEQRQRLGRLEPVPVNMDVGNQQRLVYNLLAAALRRQGRPRQAEVYEHRVEEIGADIKAMTRARHEQAARPKDMDLLFRLGNLYLKIGMNEEGEDCLLRVLAARPGDRPAHQALGRYYRCRSDPKSQRLADRHERLAGTDP